MDEIVAVLVVPAEGDPGGLLAGAAGSSRATGRFGYAPPIVRPCRGCRRWDHYNVCAHLPSDPIVEALPLWWDGALVPEGWDRARRVYAAGCRAVGHHETAAELGAMSDPADAEEAERLGYGLVGFTVAYSSRGQRLASRVVRLARVDGRLVEQDNTRQDGAREG